MLLTSYYAQNRQKKMPNLGPKMAFSEGNLIDNIYHIGFSFVFQAGFYISFVF